MTIRRNDTPVYRVPTRRFWWYGAKQSVNVVRIVRDLEPSAIACGSNHSDLAQRGNDFFAEQQPNTRGRFGELCIRGRSGTKERRMEQRSGRRAGLDHYQRGQNDRRPAKRATIATQQTSYRGLQRSPA